MKFREDDVWGDVIKIKVVEGKLEERWGGRNGRKEGKSVKLKEKEERADWREFKGDGEKGEENQMK